jgi:hypothetical protein
MFGGIILLPVLHEHARDLMALLFQPQGRHGGVHATRNADDDIHEEVFTGLTGFFRIYRITS